MKIEKKILNTVLRFFCIFLRFFKVKKNKISFISLESDKLEGDFLMLANELTKNTGYDVYYELFKFKKNLVGYMSYFLECIRQLFVINTSALVILDYNNYVVSNFKRKEVKVLQLWHSSGAIKKFGNLVERDYRIHNYDYAIVNTDEFRPVFAKALDVKEKNIITTGIPKTDALFDKRQLEQKGKVFLRKHNITEDKRVILYAPTFRGRLMTDFTDIYLDIKKVKEALGEEYVILYRLHPLVQKEISEQQEGIICCNSEELYTLMFVSDMLISDYSALIIDYSVMHKPMFFYVPDLEEYREAPGIAVDYEKEMPGRICFTEEELVGAIKNGEYSLERVKEFQKKYFPYMDGKSNDRVVRVIDNIMSIQSGRERNSTK